MKKLFKPMNIVNAIINITQLPFHYLTSSRQVLKTSPLNDRYLINPVLVDFYEYRNTYCINNMKKLYDKMDFQIEGNPIWDYANDDSNITNTNEDVFLNQTFSNNLYKEFDLISESNRTVASTIITAPLYCRYNYDWLNTVHEIRLLENEISRLTGHHRIRVIEVKKSDCIQRAEFIKAAEILELTKINLDKAKNNIEIKYFKPKNLLEEYIKVVNYIIENEEKTNKFCNSRQKYIAVSNYSIIYSDVYSEAIQYLYDREQAIISLLPKCEKLKKYIKANYSQEELNENEY